MALECGQLAETQSGEGRQEDEHPKACWHGIGEPEDLGDIEEGPFRCLGRPRALDAAGVALDQLVVDGGVHDGAEDLIRLDDRRLTHTGFQQPGTPAPNLRCGDLAQHHVRERRQDVEPQRTAVALTRGRGVVALLEPGVGVHPEEDLVVRVLPSSVDDLRFLANEPTVCIGLRRERLGRRTRQPIRALVAGLEASGRQLAHRSETTPLALAVRHQATAPNRRRTVTGWTVLAATYSSKARSGIRTCRPP